MKDEEKKTADYYSFANSIHPSLGNLTDSLNLIKKYYDENSELYRILFLHSLSVTQKALDIARKNPREEFDLKFIEEAAMLHDIGIYLTNAPGIYCFGEKPYICHGYSGSELLQKEGLPKHALVCERHTGTGISLKEIERENLPLPRRDFMPVSKEEKLICYADKFFSKTKLGQELLPEKIISSLSKFGKDAVSRFQEWHNEWGI